MTVSDVGQVESSASTDETDALADVPADPGDMPAGEPGDNSSDDDNTDRTSLNHHSS